LGASARTLRRPAKVWERGPDTAQAGVGSPWRRPVGLREEGGADRSSLSRQAVNAEGYRT